MTASISPLWQGGKLLFGILHSTNCATCAFYTLIQMLLNYNTLLADSSWLAAWRASEAGVCNSRRRIASADAATCLPKGVVGT